MGDTGAGTVLLYDTTLRDGTQREGLSLSVEDKLRIARELDVLGVRYIEGGWPGSNPKDAEFFARARQLRLRNAKVTAFGCTRHARNRCEDDPNILALVEAETPVVALVGKASSLHVEKVLETTRDQNLRMISESVAYLKGLGKEVVYDGGQIVNPSLADYQLPSVRDLGPRWAAAIRESAPGEARIHGPD